MNKLFKKIAGLSLGLAMAIGVGVAVGSNQQEAKSVSAADQTATWTATSGGLGSGVGSGTITDSKGYSWSYTRTLKSGASYSGWTSSCIQLGKNGGVENLTLTTSSIPGTIKSVGIECSSYQGKHNVLITVGSTTYLASTATASWTTVNTKSGTGTSSGAITISFTGGTRALYIKSLTVTYNNDTPSKTLSKIDVYDNSGKTWHAGDVVAATDLRVVATYSSGDPATITDGTGVTITSGATLAQGSNTVSVSYTDTYGTATNSVSITAAAAISLSSIAVTTAPTKTTYDEGDTFDSTGMVVTATYSDSSTANVTSSCVFTPSTALTTDVSSISISYTYKGVEKTTTQAITVNEKHGTSTNPYTVAEALAAIASGQGITGVYVRGIVSQIVTAYSSQHHNITFDISSDGTTTSDQLRVYRCVSGNVTISSDNDVLVEDEIVASGDLTTYGDIKEFAQGCQLQERTRKTISSLTVTDNSGKTWFAGDTVATTDLQVVVNYSNGTNLTVTDGTGVTITSGASLSQGSNTVNVSFTNIYGTQTGSVSINASAVAVLDSVTISGTATADKNGPWDLSGLTVYGTSEGGTAGDMGNITEDCVLTSPASTATPGNTTITVHVNYKGGTKQLDVTGVAATIANAESFTDTINRALTGIAAASNYGDWSGKQDSSDAIYAGNSAGDHDSVQLRTSSHTGIITTASGGTLKSVTINFNSNTAATRTVSVYGKTSAYSSIDNLFDSSTQGTLLGEVNIDNGASQTITINSETEYSYVGIRSKSGAMYLDSIEIVWRNIIQTKTLSSLTVTTNPTKTTYAAGETLNLTGMVVTASYEEEGVDDAPTVAFTTSPVEGYTFTAEDGVAGTKLITITSTEDNQITTSFSVTVTPKKPTALNRTSAANWTDSQTLAQGTGRWKAVFSDASEQTNIKIGDLGTTLKIGGVAVDTSSLASDYAGQEATLEFTAEGVTVSNTFTVAVSAELSVDSFEGVPDYVLVTETSDIITANFTSLNGEPTEYSVVSSNAAKLSVSFDSEMVEYDSTTKVGSLMFTVTAGSTQGQYMVTVSVTYGQRTESKSVSIVVMGEAPTPSGVQYELITSLDDVTTGKYVVAADVNGTYYALSTVSSGKPEGTTVAVSNNIISEENAGSLPVDITRDGNTIAISKSGSYFTYPASGTNLGVSSTATYYDVETISTGGSFKVNGTNRGLVYRASTYNVWGAYSNGNINGTEYFGIVLFKQVSSAAEKTSFDWVKEFVDGYMYMNSISLDDKGSGACQGENGYYLTAKRAWNTMISEYEGSDNLQTVFQTSFTDAYERYMSWASACGDSAPFIGTSIVRSTMLTSLFGSTKNSGTTIAIIAISAVSLAAIGGYFFFRKKKEDK